MTDLLTTHHLGYPFAGGRRLLAELDISLSRGRYGLRGANGAGKTTLLQLLAGGLRASEGSVSRRPRQRFLPGRADAGRPADCGCHGVTARQSI